MHTLDASTPIMSIDMMACESVMRVHVGLIWFYQHPPTSSLEKVVQKIQVGVDKVVLATPELGGILRDGIPVRIEYTTNTKVSVTSIKVPYSYIEMEKGGFSQEKYSQIFDIIPSITPDIEGLEALRVWVFGLSCGGVAVGIAIHHILGDGMAATDIATSIGRACVDPEYKPMAMWSSRSRKHEILMASLKGDEKVDDSYIRHLYQNTPASGGGSLQTQGR
ncbi:hypothetical protein GGI09_006856, partial [Coemansia sp. S100]